MSGWEKMDSHKSYLNAKKYIDEKFSKGEMSREEAHRLSKESKKNYSNESYNKEMEKLNGKG